MPEQASLYADNPNPDAKIGFVLFYPFQFYVEKNIYKYLRKDAEFIIDMGVFFPVKQPEELLKSILALLKKHNAHYRILSYDSYFFKKSLENFFAQYGLLVSLWERGCVEFNCNLSKKKVRLGYGSGKELTMYRPSGRIFDLVLAYGPRDAQAFSLLTETKIVGIPKFDDWFNNEFDNELLASVRKRLDPKKKTLLYLPTHSDLGSIKDLAEPLKKLSGAYNTVVKLHYLNITDEPELVERLEHPDLVVLKDDVDLLPLLKIADVVLSDNSSAIFDAILADKPLVVTDFLSDDYLNVSHKDIKHYRRGKTSGLTYTGSMEQKIKKEGLVVTMKKAEELAEGVKQALEDKPFYQEARKKINAELTAYNDGKCGERAAAEIRNLLHAAELPERPPLYHALEIYEKYLRVRSFSGKKSDAQKIARYENLLFKKVEEDHGQRIIFSVVLAYDPGRTEFLEGEFLSMTLRSLLEQNFPTQNYEILIVNGPPEQEVRKIIDEIPKIDEEMPAIRCLAPWKKGGTLAFLGMALKEARGEIICFTQNGYLAPADWLLSFFLIYQEHPNVVGAGGYVIKHSSVKSILDEYYYSGLGRKLGIHWEGRLYPVENQSFYQNPAGTLANMSYKKESLKALKIPFERMPALLELAEIIMKRGVLREEATLYFLPSRVTDLEKATWKGFLKKNFLAGLAFYLYCYRNPRLKKYYSYNFFSVIKLPVLNILDGYWKVRLTFLIFLGALLKWLGSVYGAAELWKHESADHQ